MKHAAASSPDDNPAPPSTVPEALAATTARDPNARAIWDPHSWVDYATLSTRAAAVASCLRARGLVVGDRVAIYMDKSVNAVVAMYGVMAAGGVCVPIDPSAPTQRVAQIIQGCCPQALITVTGKQKKVLEILPQSPSVRFVLGADSLTDAVSNLTWAEAFEHPTTDPVNVSETDLAYILYTSGSTGTPKGIMHTHRSALAFARWAAETYELRPTDRLSNHAPFHFDLSTFDLYATMLVGAAVFIIPSYLTRFPHQLAQTIEQEGLTVWYSVPFALVDLVARGNLAQRTLPHLRWVLFAGEPFPPRQLSELAQALPHARLSNLFGPTETNVCTYYHLDAAPDPEQPLPIGIPVEVDEVLIVDEQGDPVGLSDPGELLVRGATVMAGYWAQDELNACAFTTCGDDPRPWYRTGDMVWQDPRGILHYLGRRDRQVKVRGYRVELDEVEHALAGHAGVSIAAVYLSHAGGMTAVHAVVVPSTPELDHNTLYSQLRSLAAARLPSYSVPTQIDVVAEIPRTSTGKIDRLALADRDAAITPTAESTHDKASA